MPKGGRRASQGKEMGKLSQSCIWKGDNEAIFPAVPKFLDFRQLSPVSH